jgi:peroxiredoxin
VTTSQSEFSRRGVSTIIISFAEPAMLVRYQEYHNWPFPILADPHRRAYQAFALPRLPWWRVFSPATLKLYSRLLRQGMKRQGYGKEDIRQAGGDFLIDRAGNILFAHRSRDPADRPSREILLREIDRVMAARQEDR